MKRILYVLFTLIFSILLFSCSEKIDMIEAEEVQKIIVWTHDAECEIDNNDIEKFVELYNASTYAGKANGEGGTPDFGISVYLNEEKQIGVNDFIGEADFEVFASGRSFYMDSDELHSFVESLADKYVQQ